MILLIASNLLKGSKKTSSLIGVEMCSQSYWIIFAVFIACCFLVCLYCTIRARNASKGKRQLAFRKSTVNFEGEVTWTGKQTIMLISVALLGGMLAAIVGIGGGVIYSPLLLELGIPPKVASSTAMMLVLYTSMSNVIQFAINQAIIYQFAVWLSVWIVCGTLLGLTTVNKAVKKSGRQSIIVFLLMSVLLLAAGVTITLDAMKSSSEVKDHESIW